MHMVKRPELLTLGGNSGFLTHIYFFSFGLQSIELSFFMQHGIAALHLKTFVDWTNLGKLSIAIKPLMILEY